MAVFISMVFFSNINSPVIKLCLSLPMTSETGVRLSFPVVDRKSWAGQFMSGGERVGGGESGRMEASGGHWVVDKEPIMGNRKRLEFCPQSLSDHRTWPGQTRHEEGQNLSVTAVTTTPHDAPPFHSTQGGTEVLYWKVRRVTRPKETELSLGTAFVVPAMCQSLPVISSGFCCYYLTFTDCQSYIFCAW